MRTGEGTGHVASREHPDLAALTLADGELFHDRKGRVRLVPAPVSPLADSHGHVTCLETMDASVALARAALAGVRMLVVPVDPVADLGGRWRTASELLAWLDESVDRAHGLLDEYARRGLVPPTFEGRADVPEPLEWVRIAAGVHPYGGPEWVRGTSDAGVDVRRELEVLLGSGRCVGVGEIGLDYGPYNEADPALQERAFREQLAIARDAGLPCELHVRDASDDPACSAHALAERVLGEDGIPERGCDLHCFTSGPAVLEPFVRLGCHVAFGGAATFNRSDDIREAAALCPANLILSETDSPYMAPVPLRGQECEPAMVGITAARLSEVRAQAGVAPAADTLEALWSNACDLFDLHVAVPSDAAR